jgi:virginiamycin A acetyltransferase
MKFLTIQMNDRLRDFLWEMHIIPKPWQRPSLADIRTLQVPPGLKVEPFTRHVFRRPDQTLILTSARHMTYTHAALPRSRIGAYCSVALGVAEMGDTHPVERVSTHLFSYDGYYRNLATKMGAKTNRAWTEFKAAPPDVTIGNDVWIGADALLKGGITIGDGAVIAARAVVTKDVPPYAIVGGTPAQVIRYRFPAELCARLMALSWWDYDLADIVGFPMEDPESFCTAFEAAKPGLTPRNSKPITAQMLTDLA